jgi:hypothetical protein
VIGLPWSESTGNLAGAEKTPLRLGGPLTWFQVLQNVEPGSTFGLCNEAGRSTLEGGRTVVFACPVDTVELYGTGATTEQHIHVRYGLGPAPADLGPVRTNARIRYLGRRGIVCPAQVSALEPSFTGAPYPSWTSDLGVPGTVGPIVDAPRAFVAVAQSSVAAKPFTLHLCTFETQLVLGDPVPLVSVASSAARGGRHTAGACLECLPGAIQVYVSNLGVTTNTVEVAAWLVW